MAVIRIELEKLYRRFSWLRVLSEEIGTNPQSVQIVPCTIEALDHWCGFHQSPTEKYDVKGYFFGKENNLLEAIHPHLSIFDKIEKRICASHTLGTQVRKAAGKSAEIMNIRCVVIIVHDLKKSDGTQISLYFLPKETSMFQLIVDWADARHDEVSARISRISEKSEDACV